MKPPHWLLLAHQLPNEPSNLRVRVWRKLQAFGAVPIKNSIYVLPNGPAAREDFEWLRKDIVQSGGEATIFVADSVAETANAEIVRDFREARSKDYVEFAGAARAFAEKVRGALYGGHVKTETLDKLEREWSAHRLEWERLGKIDFFKAPDRPAAAAALGEAQRLLHRAKAASVRKSPAPPPPVSARDFQGRIWVTRRSPHIDRLASAWLIRRFVDPKARFKFVDPPYAPRARELRFDMAEGEFTHFGDWCTFEALIRRLGLQDAGLDALAEIVHDVDLKDRKFGRPEASGLALAVRGLCRRYPRDSERLEAGAALFDGIFAALRAEGRR